MESKVILESKIKDIIELKDGTFHKRSFSPVVVLFEDGIAAKNEVDSKLRLLELGEYGVCESDFNWDPSYETVHEFLNNNDGNLFSLDNDFIVILSPSYVIVTKKYEEKPNVFIHKVYSIIGFDNKYYKKNDILKKGCYRTILHASTFNELKGM